MEITTLGIDLAKSVFQLHGVDGNGAVVLQKKLRRATLMSFLGKLQPCLVGMEACPTSHYWAREIAALGHDVRLIPPAYVKPYVKRQKNDAADADPAVFKSGRQFAAWLGLVPRQNSSGGKERLGAVSKMGNGYLRRLLVVGATSVTRRAPTNDSRTGVWIRSLMERKPKRLVTVAIANKTARTAWALLKRGDSYRAAPAA